MRGDPPAYSKVAHNQVVYDRRELDALMSSRRRRSTSDEGEAA